MMIQYEALNSTPALFTDYDYGYPPFFLYFFCYRMISFVTDET